MVRPLGVRLDEKAIEAVAHWRFRPALRNGEPVRVLRNVEVSFRLLQSSSVTLTGMRPCPTLLLALLSASLLSAAGNATPIDVAQQLFDAMKTHDTAAASALFVPGASLASIDAAGKASAIPFEKFVEHIGSTKNTLLERMWNPKVLEDGPIAVLWADYDFHLDGKFTHCGIDSFSMLKTADTWKITALSYSRIKSGCAPSPLGAPDK